MHRSVVFSLVLIYSGSAVAQYNCPSGSLPVAGGGGYMCQCADGSFANIDGCKSVHSDPYSSEPQQYQAPTVNIEANPIINAFEQLGDLFMRGDKKVSPSGALSDQLSAPAPSPPPNQAAEEALKELLSDTTYTPQPSSKTTQSFNLPNYPAQPPAPAPTPPKSTCSDWRNPDCFVTLKPAPRE